MNEKNVSEKVRYLLNDKWVVQGNIEQTQKNLVDTLGSMTSEELHQFALGFNLDCGFGALEKVVLMPQCDLGTVLVIYHKLRPGFYYNKIREKKDFRPYETPVYEFVRKLETLAQDGSIKKSTIPFDPASVGGFDVTKDKTFYLLPDFMKEKRVQS